MKHRKEIIITTIVTVIICFVAVPFGVNYAWGHAAPADVLATRLEAADVLNYIATTLAFIGTFFWVWLRGNKIQICKKSRQICLLQIILVKYFWRAFD